MQVSNIESIKIKLASPEEILSWSYGEVTKSETINYRTQRAEKDGLFCEKIFGPEKDYECYCGKYKRIRYKGVICDRCGVEITKSSVRRERMGHIKLACPVAHIWFLRGIPSNIAVILDVAMRDIENVIYFTSYIITKTDEKAKKNILEQIRNEYKQKIKNKSKEEIRELKLAKDKAENEVLSLKPLTILSETEYRDFSFKYGEVFEAGIGAEALREIFEKINLKKMAQKLRNELNKASLKKFNEAKRRISRRLKIIELMLKNNIRPEWMFFTILPVIPPDLRPVVQLEGLRYASVDLNEFYRRVINRNNRLKHLFEINAPEVIIRNEKRMLQEAVDALIDNQKRKEQITTAATTGGRRALKSLADALRGKQGRFRQNLLGKRVDYSGRSVIVVGPELKLYQCGLPKYMALELFKPFVIGEILKRELAYNPKAALRLIDKETDEVWEILERIIKNKVVLLNRAPTLHRLGVQAFQPILVEGKAIQIHPLVCEAFNADFDGDAMAVHLPLSEEAQREARDIMLSSKNFFKPATGMVIVDPVLDIILGCYYLTRIKQGAKGEGKMFTSFTEACLAYELGKIDIDALIKVKKPGISSDSNAFSKKIKKNQLKALFLETSVGRIIFNQVFPKGHTFINERVNASKLEKIINEVIEKYKIKEFLPFLDKIKNLGFEFATQSGITLGIDDLIVPSKKFDIIKESERKVLDIESYYEKGLITKEEKDSQVIEAWHMAKSKIENLVQEVLPAEGPALSIINSGAKGSLSQLIQMSGMKGLPINPAGKIIALPVKNSYKEGLNVLEYFVSTHGARKGIVDTALQTSVAGYLTRRLVDVAHDVIITEKDCGDKNGITISKEQAQEIDQNFTLKIIGRMTLEDIKDGKRILVKKGEIINYKQSREIIEKLPLNKKIKVRSPMTCQATKGICQNCYGWNLGINALVRLGEAVGVVAAQSIGEPGTQLTMRTFHTGGVAGETDITTGLPRLQEIFEVRPPAIKALISHIEGEVIDIKEEKSGAKLIKIKPVQNKKNQKQDIVEYKIPLNLPVLIEKGKKVERGQQLCEGNVDLRELLKIVGEQETQARMVKEVQKVYVSQGAFIHDKHIEIIVRQMFSRVRIQESGESVFTKGELREKGVFIEENERLKKEKKKLATAQSLLLGISKVALSCEGFLSAASFQETSGVLTKAAIEGKEDNLQGLKENVIIGKLMPAGTGFKKLDKKVFK